MPGYPIFIRFALLALALLVCASCVSARYTSPAGGAQRVALATPEQPQCEIVNRQGQWSLLFGFFPINRPALLPATAQAGRSYRIVEESRLWPDLLVNVLGGWAVTLTRRTLTLEACNEDLVIAPRARLNSEQAGELDRWLVARRDRVALELADGSQVRGQLLEISPDEYVIDTEGASDAASDPDANQPKTSTDGAEPEDASAPVVLVDRLELRNGEILEGTIVSQSRESLTIQTARGRRQLSKSDIARTVLQVPATLVRETKQRIPRAQVVRLRLGAGL